MLRELYETHKGLTKFLCATIIVGILLISLIIVDGVQKYNREQVTVGEDLKPGNNDIKSYNVEGMTDEEIEDMLEQERNEVKN